MQVSGGVARQASLNHRLNSVIPPGCGGEAAPRPAVWRPPLPVRRARFRGPRFRGLVCDLVIV